MKGWGESKGPCQRMSLDVGSKLSSEAAHLTFALESCGEELRPAPIVYVPDLWEDFPIPGTES